MHCGDSRVDMTIVCIMLHKWMDTWHEGSLIFFLTLPLIMNLIGKTRPTWLRKISNKRVFSSSTFPALNPSLYPQVHWPCKLALFAIRTVHIGPPCLTNTHFFTHLLIDYTKTLWQVTKLTFFYTQAKFCMIECFI